MNEFVAEWETLYYKCKNADCELPDIVLSFELLEAAQLDERETQLVLTGVDYQTGKVQRKLLKQMNASLKKLKGKLAVFTDNSSVDSQQVIKTESTYISQQMETTLVANGWKKPLKCSHSPTKRSDQGKKYLGKKNSLRRDGKPIKCFACKCENTTTCTCTRVYHLADQYKKNGDYKNSSYQRNDYKTTSLSSDARSDLGLFMSVNIPDMEGFQDSD